MTFPQLGLTTGTVLREIDFELLTSILKYLLISITRGLLSSPLCFVDSTWTAFFSISYFLFHSDSSIFEIPKLRQIDSVQRIIHGFVPTYAAYIRRISYATYIRSIASSRASIRLMIRVLFPSVNQDPSRVRGNATTTRPS